jgi:NADPH:quinone reductase-like Zn-dependent oxidoreductase
MIETVEEARTMKAVRIHAFGGPESLELEDVTLPSPGPGQVLVRIHAASVNPCDWKMREGLCGEFPMPRTLGCDFSGVVESLGSEVMDFSVGQSVFGRSDFGGAFAELTVVPVGSLVAKPSSIDDIQAAATPLCALTAWQALYDSAGLHTGQKILIHGAAGGVGMFAVQLALRQGAYVIATASPRNLAFLRRLGAQQVIDHTSTQFEDVVKGVDVVLDLVGGETQDRSWKVLKSGGRLLSTVSAPSQNKAFLCGVRAEMLLVRNSADELAMIGDLIANGEIKVMVDKVMPLIRAPEALEMNRCGHARGKIVLTMDPAFSAHALN